jgi:hypothetical protein
MKKDLCDQLHLDYPHIFTQKISVDTGDGWFGLIENLCAVVEGHIKTLPEGLGEQIFATQFKEKYGTLRTYFSHETTFMDGAITMAELMSGFICEHCGHPGDQRPGGWIKTLCDSCYEINSK